MEIFLLLLDELDDAATTACVLFPRALGFLLASGVFALSVMTAVQWPNLALATLMIAVPAAMLPLLRLMPLLRVKTDL